MVLRFLAAWIVLLFGVECLGQHQPAECLSYEPSVVSLHGTLIRRTFPGPPNYRDVHEGDKAETYWLLKLASAVCVNQEKSDPNINVSQRNVREVQLVLEPETYAKDKVLIGETVVASGTLSGAISGHHHTPVLLKVNSMQRAR